MRKTLTRIGAFLLALVLCMGAPTAVLAETSYTYNYDFWEEYQECPDAYTVAAVVTSSDLGLDLKFKSPQALTVVDDKLYVCDTGNNRIVVLQRTSKEKLEVVEIIDSFKGDVEVTTFNAPSDVAVSEQGNIFICDTNNNRILKLDSEYNYIMEFTKPNDKTLAEDFTFSPTKLVVDTAERVYALASGINKGLVKYENDGVFSGFVGATPVSYDLWTYIWKRFSTQEQLAQMENFVPTEYCNIYRDHEGFMYVTSISMSDEDLDAGKADAVRKLNLLGSDILVRNGFIPNFGDIYWGTGGGYTGPSRFIDVTVFDNDIYTCLDRNRGRLFMYDDQGRLICAFGGNGNQDGYFRSPSSIEHMGHDLLVLDQLDCAITIFIPTEFGSDIFEAVDSFDEGEYDTSEAAWRRVMTADGNYELAYIGIGRALLRQKEYKDAMKYFKMKYDADNYSKAFKQYRKEWVEDNIGIIIAVLLVLILVPGIIGRIKKAKWEIDNADIFQR